MILFRLAHFLTFLPNKKLRIRQRWTTHSILYIVYNTNVLGLDSEFVGKVKSVRFRILSWFKDFEPAITLFAALVLVAGVGVVWEKNTVGWLVAGCWCWSGVREKYCWLAGGWRLVLELCERKMLLAGWRNQTTNRVIKSRLRATRV